MKKLRLGIKVGLVLVGLLIPTLLFLPSKTTVIDNEIEEHQEPKVDPVKIVREYLELKKSPLADYTEHILQHENWRLLIAISAIESQFCKSKIDFNCWGIGGDSAYRHYKNYEEAITDADAVIEGWHQKGRWLTPEDMNCSYVVPCNPNWVIVVNKILKELNIILPQGYESN